MIELLKNALDSLQELLRSLVANLAVEYRPDEWAIRNVERRLPTFIDKFGILPEEIKTEVNDEILLD